MDHFEKARIMGVDERTISMSQQPMPRGLSPMILAIHEVDFAPRDVNSKSGRAK